ncbi:hypothetical protein Bpro_5417 (plasmid) [Polaromonas sp. JS666]|nr:hypothetical protein Bpro_5417 [Polaromonas sp. JS666]
MPKILGRVQPPVGSAPIPEAHMCANSNDGLHDGSLKKEPTLGQLEITNPKVSDRLLKAQLATRHFCPVRQLCRISSQNLYHLE